jgi:twitching motility two-component system response regulator PilG
VGKLCPKKVPIQIVKFSRPVPADFPSIMRLEVQNTTTSAVPHTNSLDSSSQAATEALNTGIRHAQSGDRVNARVALMRAAELDEKSESAWLWLASISEYPEELMAFLDNVLSINPENERAVQWMAATKVLLAKTFLQRGSDAAEAGQPSYAEDCFRKALEYDRDFSDAWLALAALSADNTERTAFFERVLSIDPTNETALAELKNIQAEDEARQFAEIKKTAFDGDVQTAIASLINFNDRFPTNVDAWMLRSHLVVKPAEKLSALKHVLELQPKNKAAKLAFESLNQMFAAIEQEAEQKSEKTEGSQMVEHVCDSAAADFEFESPIAPPQEALVFDVGSNVQEIPDTIFVGAEETSEIRNMAGSAEPVADWNRETEFYDAVITPDDIAATRVADEAMSDAFDAPVAIPIPFETPLEPAPKTRTGFETTVAAAPEDLRKNQICPFCATANDDIAFACTSCRAVLSLSDIELVLANNNADKYIIRKAVESMESERKDREFDAAEVQTLGIGHLNLRNLQFGFNYLQEASRMDPDNIVLSGQVNSLLIRMEEIRRQEEAHAALVKGKTILVVDDSATVRKLIAGKLEKSGHIVVCSNDGEDALETIKSVVPDLVLLDIAMPGMDGYQVCRQIRGWSSTANTPVVMISGKDGFFDKMRGKMAGAVGHITKPFGPETLMKAVEYYLGGGTDLDAEQQVLETESVN